MGTESRRVLISRKSEKSMKLYLGPIQTAIAHQTAFSSSSNSSSSSRNLHQQLQPTYAHLGHVTAEKDIARKQSPIYIYILGMYRVSIRYPVSAGYLTIRYYPDPVK